MRKSAEEGGAIQVHDEKGVLYQMCGLGVNCQIDSGKPSNERMLLLRREGLELALYSFRYLKDVKQVVVLIPRRTGQGADHGAVLQPRRRCAPSSTGR